MGGRQSATPAPDQQPQERQERTADPDRDTRARQREEAQQTVQDPPWICRRCTVENNAQRHSCHLCDTPRGGRSLNFYDVRLVCKNVLLCSIVYPQENPNNM